MHFFPARASNRGDVCWQVSNSWGHTVHRLRSSSSSKNQVMLALMPTVLFAGCSLMHVWLLVQVVANERWHTHPAHYMDSSLCTLFLLSHLHKLLLDIDWEMRVHPSSNNLQSAQWKMNWPKMQSTTLCPLSSVRRYRLHGFVFIPSALVLQSPNKAAPWHRQGNSRAPRL